MSLNSRHGNLTLIAFAIVTNTKEILLETAMAS
jgi:hypothetical protein